MSSADLIASIKRDLESAQLLLDGALSRLATVATGGSDPTPKKHHWYPARNDIVIRDYPIGVPNETIAERVNALPGDSVALKAIAIQAHRLGVGRPEGYTWGFAKKTSDFAGGPPVASKASSPKPVAHKPPVAPQPNSRVEALLIVSRAIEAKPAATAPKTSFNSFSGPRNVRPATVVEEDMIAQHIANKGVTKLPAAAVEFTTATISAEDRAAIVAHRAQQEAAEFAKMTGWRVTSARGSAASKKAAAMRSRA